VLGSRFSFSRNYAGVRAALLLCNRWERASWECVLGRLFWGSDVIWHIAKSVRIMAHEDVMIVLAPFIVGRM
jgi:hypothetical protein